MAISARSDSRSMESGWTTRWMPEMMALLPFLEFALMDVYGHGIDPRGQMLKGDIVFFKDLQDLSPESDL